MDSDKGELPDDGETCRIKVVSEREHEDGIGPALIFCPGLDTPKEAQFEVYENIGGDTKRDLVVAETSKMEYIGRPEPAVEASKVR